MTERGYGENLGHSRTGIGDVEDGREPFPSPPFPQVVERGSGVETVVVRSGGPELCR